MFGIPADYMPIFWLIAAVVFTIAEVFSYQLIAIWFALGSVVSLLASLVGIGSQGQLVVFAAVAGLTLALTRPLLKKVVRAKPVRTNADQVIGTTGIVVQPISSIEKGRVSANGLDWSARTEGGEVLAVGDKVTVLAIEGVTLLVKKAE